MAKSEEYYELSCDAAMMRRADVKLHRPNDAYASHASRLLCEHAI